MAAINEAYRVLGEPARRAVYDAACAAPAPPPDRPRRRRRPHRAPARSRASRCHRRAYPWKLVLVMSLLGIAVVLIGAALYRPKDPGPPDNLLEPGSCVTIEANGDARETNCATGPASSSSGA